MRCEQDAAWCPTSGAVYSGQGCAASSKCELSTGTINNVTFANIAKAADNKIDGDVSKAVSKKALLAPDLDGAAEDDDEAFNGLLPVMRPSQLVPPGLLIAGDPFGSEGRDRESGDCSLRALVFFSSCENT